MLWMLRQADGFVLRMLKRVFAGAANNGRI